jgi:hypothetical protein
MLRNVDVYFLIGLGYHEEFMNTIVCEGRKYSEMLGLKKN